MRKATGPAGLVLAAFLACGASAEPPENHYRDYCANCHGADPSGGMGFPLIREGRSDRELARIIREGLPNAGMPAFGNVLSDADIGALVGMIRRRSNHTEGGMVGTRVPADALDEDHSFGYQWVDGSDGLRYLGHFGAGGSLCYDGIDLTGVRSILLEYTANTEEGDPGRFAVLAYPRGDETPINLGEKTATVTGGWEEIGQLRVGLSRQLSGSHRVCFVGVYRISILNLLGFILSDQAGENEGVTPFEISVEGIAFLLPTATISAGGHDFRLEAVGNAPGVLWSMDFLPDGSLVATQREGRLWLFKDGKRLGPVTGIPEVWAEQPAGLLGVRAHPDYADNGWLYLAFSDPGSDGGIMTRVVRGRIEGLQWVNQEDIYRASTEHYTDGYAHFGGRLLFRDGYLYFSVGDRLQQDLAQDPAYPFGKIHRLHDDGRVPEDNPFVDDENALGSIWSYGHREPQGMALQPDTGALWSAEHGPRGGDELNLIHRGYNYGWPVVSHGTEYDGSSISDTPYREGMEPPRHHWNPSIAVSEVEFYTGEHFPRWRNHLLVASLAARQLRLVRIEGDRVVDDRLLLGNLGRIRDVVNGPDGHLYLVFNNPNGAIYRLVPADEP